MFFHIDESGNTGGNLFDEAQPRLSYGVLSSKTNVDALGVALYRRMLKELGRPQIHANELGLGGLVQIAGYLIKLQGRMAFDFDYYFIEKLDYALVLFFDAVFDAGLNKAVKWEVYWTPMRYLFIHKLAALFDETLLRESWRLCTSKHIERHGDEIARLLSKVRDRAIQSGLDERSKEIIVDAMNYGIANPLSLDFGHPDQKMLSPNAVGFQFVVSSIALRVRKKRRKMANSIVVDRQDQFNKAQIGTHYNLSRISEGIKSAPQKDRDIYLNHPLFASFEPCDLLYDGLSDNELRISNSSDSIGLQMVDVYLWIANRVAAGRELPRELRRLWSMFSGRSTIDGISLDGMAARFMAFEATLPKLEDLTEEQLMQAARSVDAHRKKVIGLSAMKGLDY